MVRLLTIGLLALGFSWNPAKAEIGHSGGTFVEPSDGWSNNSRRVNYIPDRDLRSPFQCASGEFRNPGNCDSSNNRNRFQNQHMMSESAFRNAGGCTRNTRCPRGMAFVCDPTYRTRVCMDIELRTAPSGQPMGMHTEHSCRSYCESERGSDPGIRLPTNNEWLVAAQGTDARQCLTQAAQDRRIDPNKPTPPANQSYNDRFMRRDRRNCESRHGVRDMVGVLGQWVTQGIGGRGAGQFNGGYWAFGPSSIFYTTTAHGRGYADYSIGCRCAATPR